MYYLTRKIITILEWEGVVDSHIKKRGFIGNVSENQIKEELHVFKRFSIPEKYVI